MRRLTLNIALGSLLVAAMSLTSPEATAQSRGDRNGRGRVESSGRSSSGRSESTRSSDSRVERSSNRSNANATTINRSEVRSNRSEASNWPKTNRNNATVNTDRDNRRDQSASQSRRNGISRTFDSRKENANNNGGNGNHNGGGNNGNYRPGNNGGNSNHGGNHGGNNNNGNYRPGNNGGGNHSGNHGGNNGGYRPGGNHNDHNGGYRPGGNHNNHNGGYRPGGNHNDHNGGYRPGGNHGGYKPGPGNYHPGVNRPHDHHGMIVHRPHSWVTPVAPPIRHFRPHHHHIIRPVIPVGWHPWHKAPVIRGILGLTFGTAYYTSLDYLFDRGYEIDGYYDGIVYLRNIVEMRVTWPDVMLNYGTNNAFNSAEFHYSTSFDDLGRFNYVHRELCRLYGSPMSYNESRSGIQAVWYGGNSIGYVTLEYSYMAGRYYTTLSYSY